MVTRSTNGDFRTPEGSYRLDAAQSAQRFLPVDPGVLPERPRTCSGAQRNGWAAGRLDHDPRPAERAAARARLLRDAGLDRWLHRGHERRHGRNLADDAADNMPIDIQP